MGSVTDIDVSRNRLYVTSDGDRTDRVIVTTDARSKFNGFAVGSSVYDGSEGLTQVRIGDRVEVRGTGRGAGDLFADTVVLIGRGADGAMPGTGSNDSRGDNRGSGRGDNPGRDNPGPGNPGPGNPGPGTGGNPGPGGMPGSGPGGNMPAPPPPSTGSRYEGVVRQVNANDSRLVIENDSREMLTIIGSRQTPVHYRGETSYQIGNIEVGDRIRVDVAPANGGELRARSIDVLSSISDNGSPAPGSPNTVGSVAGRVTYIDTRANSVRIDTGRGNDITVDLRNATDENRRRIRANDFLSGDRVTATGSWVGQNTFRATGVRWGIDSAVGSGTATGKPGSGTPPQRAEYTSTVVYGTVQESLKNSSTLTVKDKDMDRTVRVMCSEDFAVRTKTGSYVAADTLKEKDEIVVKAYRDNYGNYIAQTIRLR